MHLLDEIRYAADPVATFAMLRDPAFVDRVCAATGALSHTVDVADGGAPDGAVTVRTSRDLPTDGIPEPARSFLGSGLTIVQTETWQAARPDGSRAGSLVVEVARSPLKFTGTMRLGPDGSGTVQSFDGDLKAGVPLVGGRIEKAAEPAVRRGLRAQEKIARGWLEQR